MRALAYSCLLLIVGGTWDSAESKVVYNLGIYGGTPVKITEVPYMALFRIAGDTWGCGASIVNNKFLVTAAHCDVTDKSQMRITVGTDKVVGGKDHEVESVFKHPQYNKSNSDYDIAVIKLKDKLTFSDGVKVIKMANLTLVPSPGDMMMTVGFGRTEHNQEYSKDLLKVNIPYVDREKCKKAYIADRLTVTEQMICAGGNTGKDSCKGDSGGPLVYKGSLIGVVSFGHSPCGTKGFPGVYSNVPTMIDFINKVINNNAI